MSNKYIKHRIVPEHTRKLELAVDRPTMRIGWTQQTKPIASKRTASEIVRELRNAR